LIQPANALGPIQTVNQIDQQNLIQSNQIQPQINPNDPNSSKQHININQNIYLTQPFLFLGNSSNPLNFQGGNN